MAEDDPIREATLADLGWSDDPAAPVVDDPRPLLRVSEVHRSGARAVGGGRSVRLPPVVPATVGDWVRFDTERPADSLILPRRSLIQRRAPGRGHEVQAIAANIDTVFVVTSATREFNVARLERYVALTLDAGAEAVIVLTKSDLPGAVTGQVGSARAISDRVPVVQVDARQPEARAQLAPWIAPGRTVAFLGSSGVGKSTLVNTLGGGLGIATQAARAADERGRHTTTHRQMHLLPQGGILIDTPGMRELQLTDAAAGLDLLFADLQALAATCKFRDCAHTVEPGCAIQAALTAEEIDADRVERWQTLVTEDAFNTETLAGRRWDEKGRATAIRDRRPRGGKGG